MCLWGVTPTNLIIVIGCAPTDSEVPITRPPTAGSLSWIGLPSSSGQNWWLRFEAGCARWQIISFLSLGSYFAYRTQSRVESSWTRSVLRAPSGLRQQALTRSVLRAPSGLMQQTVQTTAAILSLPLPALTAGGPKVLWSYPAWHAPSRAHATVTPHTSVQWHGSYSCRDCADCGSVTHYYAILPILPDSLPRSSRNVDHRRSSGSYSYDM